MHWWLHSVVTTDRMIASSSSLPEIHDACCWSVATSYYTTSTSISPSKHSGQNSQPPKVIMRRLGLRFGVYSIVVFHGSRFAGDSNLLFRVSVLGWDAFFLVF